MEVLQDKVAVITGAAREETVPAVTTRLVEMMDRFAMPPEKLARKVVKAVQRNRMQVRIGIDCYMGDWLKRLFPIAVHIPLRWGFEKSLDRN
jgi:short-subunit dehydrogenase